MLSLEWVYTIPQTKTKNIAVAINISKGKDVLCWEGFLTLFKWE